VISIVFFVVESHGYTLIYRSLLINFSLIIKKLIIKKLKN